MLQTREVAVAVPVAVAVAAPFTRACVKRHLSLQTTRPSEPTGREIVMDVGGVVHPIPPHQCLITWLQG